MMNIAIELRHPPSPELAALLHSLFQHGPDHQFTLYCTIFNYLSFDTDARNVRRVTLRVDNYHSDLERRLEFDGSTDLLIRTSCDDDSIRFPWNRQIAFIESAVVNASSSRQDRERVQTFRRFLSKAGALATFSTDTHVALQENPWVGTREVKLLTGPHDSRTFLELLERVEVSTKRETIRVTTPPLVSIVTPSFNQGRLIQRTIESVLNQGYPHLEYRVVDGGSTDETLAILKSYGTRIRWVSEPDQGQADAINKGLSRAKGQVQAYLNSDDILRSDAVEAVVEHFQNHPACDMVYGRAAYVDADDHYVGMYPTEAFQWERLMEECCICQPAAFWRRRISDTIGPFDPSFHLAMDYDYWLRMAAAGGSIETTSRLLAHSRLHGETKSAAATRDRWYEEVFRTVLQHGGYVSRTHLHKWVSACVLPRYPWLRFLRGPLEAALFRWYDRRPVEEKRNPKFRRLIQGLPGIRRVANKIDGLRRNRFEGIRPDNWLAAECRIPEVRSEDSLVLAGEAAVDMQLRIDQDHEPIRTLDLLRGEAVRITLPGTTGSISLAFSSHVQSLDGQSVAFRLYGTNLFHERDAA